MLEIVNIVAFVAVIGMLYWFWKKLMVEITKVSDSQVKLFDEMRHGVADLRRGGKYFGEQVKPLMTEENVRKAGKEIVEAAATGIILGIIVGIADGMSKQNKKGRP